MFEIVLYTGLSFYVIASLLAVVLLVRPAHFSDRWIVLSACVGAVALAIALLLSGLKSGQIPLFGRFEAITCYCLAVTIAYIHIASRDSMRGLSAFILPYVTALLIFASMAAPATANDLPTVNVAVLALHVVTAFFGYGFFTIGSALAVAYLMQDFNLKHKRLGHVFDRLPSLETADRAMRRQIKVAFALLTVSVLTGVRLVHIALWQTKLLTDPKIVSVLLTWVLYAGLMIFCAYSHRHGKKIAQITVLGLIVILFSFLGIHALTDSAHDFEAPSATQEEPAE
jgi:ABC-type uncharacterized transport system permease subunit